MKNRKIIFFTTLAVVILLMGLLLSAKDNQKSQITDTGRTETAEEQKVNTTTKVQNPQIIPAEKIGIEVNGKYLGDINIPDNADQLKTILNTLEYDKKVLFFHAPWCPFCKIADKAFIEKGNEIPTDTTVIKVDYDSHPDLKKKYGVTYQHTFVQVDNSGNMISKWTGGDIDNLKKYLK